LLLAGKDGANPPGNHSHGHKRQEGDGGKHRGTRGKLYLTDLLVVCDQTIGLVDEWTAADIDYLDIGKVFDAVFL